MKKHALSETIGWIGAVAILADYALMGLGILDGNTIIYHIIFLLGSAGLAVITYRHRAFQSFTVNTIFICLAFVAIVRLLVH